MFRKVLVANRGEIAVRAFRAATELGARTVAVFPYEDRKREHRLKADEAYQIGEEGHPVRAYLDHEAIVAQARRGGRRRDLPGLRLPLREPAPRRGVRRGRHHLHRPAGVGAAPDRQQGPRRSRPPATPGCRRCAAPSPAPTSTPWRRAADEIGFPVFVKAVAGGGGRGMRRVETRRRRCARRSRPPSARPSPPSATRRSSSRRPWSTRGTSRCRCSRDSTARSSTSSSATARCSAATRRSSRSPRRPTSTPTTRASMCADAVAFARSIGYVNAGTVEFLLGEDGRYVLHRDEPAHPGRAHGHRGGHRHRPRRHADADRLGRHVRRRWGCARTTSAPRASRCSAASRPRTPPTASVPTPARITVYRSAGGSGVRLDGGTVFVGAEVSAHFDSMLVKLTCRGMTFPIAVRRAQRALAEFRIRGVSTNIPFLEAVLADPVFQDGLATTSFIDERPELLSARVSADRATKLLTFLADVTVNRPNGPVTTRVRPRSKLPQLPDAPLPPGARDRLVADGPAAFARVAARGERRRRHRHDLPRRAPVAPRHAHADP